MMEESYIEVVELCHACGWMVVRSDGRICSQMSEVQLLVEDAAELVQ
jgi:hypothetical protein